MEKMMEKISQNSFPNGKELPKAEFKLNNQESENKKEIAILNLIKEEIKLILKEINISFKKEIAIKSDSIEIEFETEEDASKAVDILSNKKSELFYYEIEKNNNILFITYDIPAFNNYLIEIIKKVNKIIEDNFKLEPNEHLFQKGIKNCYNPFSLSNVALLTLGVTRADFYSAELAENVAVCLRKLGFCTIRSKNSSKAVILYLTKQSQNKVYQEKKKLIENIKIFLKGRKPSKTLYNFNSTPDYLTLCYTKRKKNDFLRVQKILKANNFYFDFGKQLSNQWSIRLLSLEPNDVFAQALSCKSCKNNVLIPTESISMQKNQNNKVIVSNSVSSIRKEVDLLRQYSHMVQKYGLSGRERWLFSFPTSEEARKAYQFMEKRYGKKVNYKPGKKSFSLSQVNNEVKQNGLTEKSNISESSPAVINPKVVSEKSITDLPNQQISEQGDNRIDKLISFILENYLEKITDFIWNKLKGKVILIENQNPVVVSFGNSKVEINPLDLRSLDYDEFVCLLK